MVFPLTLEPPFSHHSLQLLSITHPFHIKVFRLLPILTLHYSPYPPLSAFHTGILSNPLSISHPSHQCPPLHHIRVSLSPCSICIRILGASQSSCKNTRSSVAILTTPNGTPEYHNTPRWKVLTYRNGENCRIKRIPIHIDVWVDTTSE